MAALIAAGIAVTGAYISSRQSKRAARARRRANDERKRQARINNELSRRQALAQQRRLTASAQAATRAQGSTGSASAAVQGSLGSQTTAAIARQRQQQAADERVIGFQESANRNDARAQQTTQLASIASNYAGSFAGKG